MIRVIIPVHKIDDEIAALLNDAVKSVPSSDDVNVVISCPSELSKKLSDFGVEVISSTDESSIQSLVNQAVDEKYEYFTILEFDDRLTSIWKPNFEKYRSNRPDVSCFLMFGDGYDYKTKKPIQNFNEMAWWEAMSASQGSGEQLGSITFDSLSAFYDYCMCGAVFNTKDFIEVGMLKPSITGYFWMEYLLRATHNGQKLFVIPKIGFIHSINRDGSLLDEICAIGEDELKEWRNLAKQEYFFKEDRKKGID